MRVSLDVRRRRRAAVDSGGMARQTKRKLKQLDTVVAPSKVGRASSAREMEPASFKLPIKVVPGSSRSGIAGWLGNTLRVRITAPPERGKANAAVETLLVEVLGLSGGSARIVSGGSSPRKVVEIVGLSEAEARRILTDAAA